MCGRFTLHHSVDQIAERFAAEVVSDSLPPSYNIAPSEPIGVVRQNSVRSLDTLHWGLVPFWAKGPGVGNRMINLRVETLAEKPGFRRLLTR